MNMGYPNRPRISGIVYNCSINCALPILLEQMFQYADMEIAGQLPDIESDNLFETYTLLKESFAEAYYLSDIKKIHFNWTVFTEFLRQHDFIAVEMLFMPVLREVLQKLSEREDLDQTILDEQSLLELKELQEKTIQANGRYPFLGYFFVHHCFNKHFNIESEVHSFYSPSQSYEVIPREHIDGTPPSPSAKRISVYLKDNHYELAPHENLANAERQRVIEYQAMPLALQNVYDTISAGGSAYHTNRALGNLLFYGNEKLSRFIACSTQINAEQRAQLEAFNQPDAARYVALHCPTFDSKTAAEKRTIATILLSLLESVNEPHAKVLLNKMRIVGETKQGELLAEAVFRHWDNLGCDDVQHIMQQIEEPSGFYFNCMTALAVAGASLLVAAILLNPILPILVAVGMGVVGFGALLMSLGMFIAQPLFHHDVPNTQSLLPS